MTALKQQLLARIEASGPLTLAEYMGECLLHPTYGYYATRDPLGAKGDFTTAPEISQMFGEMIGLALAQSWLDQDRPAPFTLAEIGPGRGTLMADILRVGLAVPGVVEAAGVHLVEASPVLREVQATTLGSHEVSWHDHVSELPDQPLFLVANEFFDALPIRQYVRDGEGWRERCVAASEGDLSFSLGPALPQPALAHRLEDTEDGQLVEHCQPAESIARDIGARIQALGGVALLIDYGDWVSLGDTFQALKDHAHEDPLAHPGEADLTAHVDFEAIARVVPCSHSRLTPQGMFLERLGITQRAQALAKGLSGDRLESHIAAHRRLTHPEEMGNLFKVLALFPDQSPPPGVEQ